MARAIWKAVVRVGSEAVPVKLYSAVQDRGIHFRLLHEKDLEPVKQRMVNSITGEEVPRERIRKGYEAEPGVFVILEDEELAELEPAPSRDVEITRFVDPIHIDHQWYDRPYYLGPDGDDTAYAALVKALAAESTEGVARWTMRKKRYIGALRADGEHLALITLRHTQEVVPAAALEPPGGRALDEREVAMARQLVGALEADFDPSEYHDEYRERVLALIEAKAQGRALELQRPRRRKAQKSLADALEASLRSARKEKGRAA
ncbi:MAG: Ku protein [Longimicrobiales bacterium]